MCERQNTKTIGHQCNIQESGASIHTGQTHTQTQTASRMNLLEWQTHSVPWLICETCTYEWYIRAIMPRTISMLWAPMSVRLPVCLCVCQRTPTAIYADNFYWEYCVFLRCAALDTADTCTQRLLSCGYANFHFRTQCSQKQRASIDSTEQHKDNVILNMRAVSMGQRTNK